MCKYSDSRYYNYADILNGPRTGNLLSLLPLKLKNNPITVANSFLINGYGGKNLNMDRFKHVSLSTLYHSTQFIAQKHYDTIFQIVVVGECFYINPWFVQPPEMLYNDYFVVGRYKENKRAVLFKASKLFANRIFRPHHNSVCVIGAARNPPTIAHQEAIDRNNIIISIDDYVKLLKNPL